MSEKKKLVPKRRFKEFENADPWEQQKVESLFKITRGYVLAADKTSLRKTKTMKYPVYSSQTFNNGLLGYYNEFLFEKAITWTTDGANAGTVCYRNEKFYSTNVNGVLISKVGYSCKAVAESLNRVAWKHVTKVGNPKLMNNTMSNIILMVPIDFEELDKISKFFTYTDNLITLHQRKLEKLKNLKSAYLSEMFPAEGERKPKRRFAGFTDDWEQRKLREIGTIMTGSTPSTANESYYNNSGIPWVTPTDISENITDSSEKRLSSDGEKVGVVVPKETILVTCIASIGKNTILGRKGSFNQQINGLIPNKALFNPYFLLMQSTLWSSKMKSIAASGTMQIINKTEFSNLLTYTPELNEQSKIGEFFYKLDNLITLHQRKLEKLQNIKKAYLNEMFI